MTQPPTVTKVGDLAEFHRQWEMAWKDSQGGTQPSPKGDEWETRFRTLAAELADHAV